MVWVSLGRAERLSSTTLFPAPSVLLQSRTGSLAVEIGAQMLTRNRTFGHGSPYNVPAGHSVNMDKVVAHYHQKHLDAEESKAKKLAAAAE
jgi:hypothetical protein